MRCSTVASVVALLAATRSAHGQTPPAANAPVTASASLTAAASPATTTAPAHPAVLGVAAHAYVTHDYERALTVYREAATHAETAAGGLLGVGYTQAARGDRVAALAAFRDALNLSLRVGDDATRARALVAIAFTDEALDHWSEALAAWQEFTRFADGHTTLVDANVGRQRIEAIHLRETTEATSAQVRLRIEERRRELAHPTTGGASGR